MTVRFGDQGTPIADQLFTLRALCPPTISKLDDDAFTRMRVVLMSGIERSQNRFLHGLARAQRPLMPSLAGIRRIEQHQETIVAGLMSADHSPLELAIAHEQTAVEVTAALAQAEPSPGLAQVYRFVLSEHVDHLYRLAALSDRLEGKDANNILQSLTAITPGRPTSIAHRSPANDVKTPYDRRTAKPLSKIHTLTLLAGANQLRDLYITVGAMCADPLGRRLFAELGSIAEQHVTLYESLIDPDETWLERWVLQEATEVYGYHSCVESEANPRVKAVWEKCLQLELGQLQIAAETMQALEHRDASELLVEEMPKPIDFKSHRDFILDTLTKEAALPQLESGDPTADTDASIGYRNYLNKDGSPSSDVAKDYVWSPGGELARHRVPQLDSKKEPEHAEAHRA